jgi:hypothetical protein
MRTRGFRSSIGFVVALGALLPLAACEPSPGSKKYGMAFNSVRRTKGIPEIPVNWVLADGSTNLDWRDPAWDGKSAGHHVKLMWLGVDGAALEETDVYYSGRSFDNPADGTLPEKVSVTYDYRPGRSASPWRVDAELAPSVPPRVGDYGVRTLTLDEADQLLSSWGFARTPRP